MDIEIIPSNLSGTVSIPSSKSAAHRILICSSLTDGMSEIKGISMSVDIKATIDCLTSLGAGFEINDDTIKVTGIRALPQKALLNCHESGSTLRFLIPVAAALGIDAQFKGEGKLPERPITPYFREFSNKGISFDYPNTMPFNLSGKLKPGTFYLEGDISSQFITGLLFALPLLEDDSEIILTSPLQSEPYIDITIDVLNKFGITVTPTKKGYKICGNQRYCPINLTVEGDYSQAAFFLTANALGAKIEIKNLSSKSVQGDKKILEILSEIGYNRSNKSKLRAFSVNAANIPDLVPILSVLACFCDGISEITNAARLRIKESDRLTATAKTLNSLGGQVEVTDDMLRIFSVKEFNGGIADSFNDHRIVMSLAIASLKSKNPIIIKNAEAVNKSYPHFFDDFNNLGGNAHVIHLES